MKVVTAWTKVLLLAFFCKTAYGLEGAVTAEQAKDEAATSTTYTNSVSLVSKEGPEEAPANPTCVKTNNYSGLTCHNLVVDTAAAYGDANGEMPPVVVGTVCAQVVPHMETTKSDTTLLNVHVDVMVPRYHLQASQISIINRKTSLKVSKLPSTKSSFLYEVAGYHCPRCHKTDSPNVRVLASVRVLDKVTGQEFEATTNRATQDTTMVATTTSSKTTHNNNDDNVSFPQRITHWIQQRADAVAMIVGRPNQQEEKEGFAIQLTCDCQPEKEETEEEGDNSEGSDNDTNGNHNRSLRVGRDHRIL